MRTHSFFFVILIATALFSCTLPIEINYTNFHSKSFSKRSQPALYHKSNLTELLNGDYLLIGYIDFRHNIRKCFSDNTCQIVDESGPSPEALAKEASSLGADTISLLDEELELKPVKKSICNNMSTRCSTNSKGIVTCTSYCISYSNYNGHMESWKKRALLWRKEPSPDNIERNQIAMQSALNKIEKSYTKRKASSSTPNTKNSDRKTLEPFVGDDNSPSSLSDDKILSAIITKDNQYIRGISENESITKWRSPKGQNAIMLSLLANNKKATLILLATDHNWRSIDDKGFSSSDYILVLGDDDIFKAVDEKHPELAIKINHNTKFYRLIGQIQNPDTIDYLSKRGLNLNKKIGRDENGLLLYAAHYGNKPIIRKLLSKGLNSNDKNKNGITPLMTAAMQGHSSTIKLLSENNSDINAIDINGNTALIWAVLEGHMDAVHALFELNADLSWKNHNGGDAVIAAITREQWPIFIEILTLDPNISLDEKTELYAINRLIEQKESDIIYNYFLLMNERNATVNPSLKQFLPKVAQEGNGEMIDAFYLAGFDLNDYYNGHLLTDIAIESRNNDALKALIKNGARSSFSTNNPDGRLTPLMKATIRGDKELVQLLRDAGVKK